MKIKHYICPRNCGKTTFAENLQMEDPENTLLFKMDRGFWRWGQNMRGERWNKIIMNEYILRYNQLNENDKDRFVSWIYQIVLNTLTKDGELILISTPDRSYSQEEIALACIGKLSADFYSLDTNKINRNIREIDNKFLNPSFKNLQIIETDLGCKTTQEEKTKMGLQLGAERYRTDVLGKYLI